MRNTRGQGEAVLRRNNVWRMREFSREWYESFVHQRESIRRVVAREQVSLLQSYRRPLLCLHLLYSTKFYTFNATMYGNSYGPL